MLSLQKIPDKWSVSRIISKAEQFAETPVTSKATANRLRLAAALRLENELIQWLSDKNNSGIALNSNVVESHAIKLLNDANALLPASQKNHTKFSKGWKDRFKKCYELKFRRIHGETIGADQGAITREMSLLDLIIATYAA